MDSELCIGLNNADLTGGFDNSSRGRKMTGIGSVENGRRIGDSVYGQCLQVLLKGKQKAQQPEGRLCVGR